MTKQANKPPMDPRISTTDEWKNWEQIQAPLDNCNMFRSRTKDGWFVVTLYYGKGGYTNIHQFFVPETHEE